MHRNILYIPAKKIPHGYGTLFYEFVYKIASNCVILWSESTIANVRLYCEWTFFNPWRDNFKAAHFTETALMAVTVRLHAARSAKLSLELILVDLSAVFRWPPHLFSIDVLLSMLDLLPLYYWWGNIHTGDFIPLLWGWLSSFSHTFLSSLMHSCFCLDFSMSGRHLHE